MIYVHHLNSDLGRDKPFMGSPEKWVAFAKRMMERDLETGRAYKLVAKVETDDLDEAYRLTNHIDRSWQENPQVDCDLAAKHRSTDTGDLMVVEGPATAEGSIPLRFFVVASFGFEEVLP